VKDHSVRAAMREVFKNYGPKLSDAKNLKEYIKRQQKSYQKQILKLKN